MFSKVTVSVQRVVLNGVVIASLGLGMIANVPGAQAAPLPGSGTADCLYGRVDPAGGLGTSLKAGNGEIDTIDGMKVPVYERTVGTLRQPLA